MTDTVQPGDTLDVGSGSTTDGTLVLWNGTLEINAGGTANGTVVNGGGLLVVDSGGTAVDSFLGGLAVENVFGTDINAITAVSDNARLRIHVESDGGVRVSGRSRGSQ